MIVRLVNGWFALPTSFRHGVISSAFTVYTIITTLLAIGFATGKCNAPGDCWGWFAQNWWVQLVTLAINPAPVVRALQGANKISQG